MEALRRSVKGGKHAALASSSSSRKRGKPRKSGACRRKRKTKRAA